MAGSAKQQRAARNARAAIGNQAALVKGSAAAKARMSALRALRGNVPVKTMSPRGAKAAFTRFYNKRSYKTSRARQAAKTRDLCTSNKPVTRSRKYGRHPNRYDYPGLDDGSQCPTGKVHAKRVLSASQKAALVARLRKQAGGAAAEHCEWHPASLRCAKATSGGVHSHCRVNKKGHCVKKASAPKDAARVARGQANVARLAAARVARAAKKGSPKAPAMPAAPRRAPAMEGVNLQKALAGRCTSRTTAADCGKGVNCSWTPAHTHKGKAVPGACGNKKGRYSLAAAQARDARK
jgi:hypothetical protein